MSSVLPLEAELVTLPDTMPEAAIEEVSVAAEMQPVGISESVYPEAPQVSDWSEEIMPEVQDVEPEPEEVVVSPAAPAEVIEEVSTDDESDLYSIRHFSV
jgi:hypothetical protein